MKRREFIALLGGAAALPIAARAQQSEKVWRIGYLGFGSASSWRSEVEALQSGLRDLGYVEGKNIIIEFRWAERADQTPDLAVQLVRMNVDVIFAPASTQVEPARKATKTIPIVFAQHADPVGLGDVASLSRPGGNITGLSMLLTELCCGVDVLCLRAIEADSTGQHAQTYPTQEACIAALHSLIGNASAGTCGAFRTSLNRPCCVA